jgi:hypothetical protein
LGNSKTDVDLLGRDVADLDNLSSATELGREPAKRWTSEAAVSVQTVEEDVVVECIEHGPQIEEDYFGSVFVVGGP